MKQLQTTLPGLISAVQTADSGSFTAAAKALDLTPAAVSKNVAALEALLKLRLFNRTTRRLALTEEGKAFIAQTRLGLAELEAATMQATQALAPQGTVRVSCSVGFGRRFVLPALAGFYAAYPQVAVDLSLNDQTVDLVAEGFDVGIRGGSQPPDGMVSRNIFKLHSCLVASPRYLQARGTPKHYSDLAGHDLIRVKFLSGRLAPWLFKNKGKIVAFDPPARLLISDPEVILDAAVQHMGIARAGAHHAYAALQAGQLVELLPRQVHSPESGMAIFYPHRVGLAPRVRVLVDYLLAVLGKEPALG